MHEVHPGIPSFKTWRTAWSLLLMKRIWRTVVYSCDPLWSSLFPSFPKIHSSIPQRFTGCQSWQFRKWLFRGIGGEVLCFALYGVLICSLFLGPYTVNSVYILMSICLHEIYMFFPYESFCAGWKGYSHWERWGIFRWTSGYLGCCSLEHAD